MLRLANRKEYRARVEYDIRQRIRGSIRTLTVSRDIRMRPPPQVSTYNA